MTRFAAVSDIHGNILALERVIADITQRGIDRVVNLGDHASGPLWPRETMDALMALPWTHIGGNHDRSLSHDEPASLGLSDAYAHARLEVGHLGWLKALRPTAQWIDDILLCHGTPSDDMGYLGDTIEHGRLRRATPGELTSRLTGVDVKIILCGHSHTPRVVHSAGGVLVVNPGSVGLQAYTDDGARPHVVEYGSPHTRYAIVTIDGDACSVDHVALPYDHRAAAKQARKNGRPEWAAALETGYVATSRV
jgi:putative phosphoesterase